MRRWLARTSLALPLVGLLMIAMAVPTTAQESPEVVAPTRVNLVTPYIGVAVEPGETASFTLDVTAPRGEVVELEVADLPDGWSADIRGGGFVVDRVMVDAGLSHNLKLEVDVPESATEGKYQVTVVAAGEVSTDRLVLDLMVAQTVGGGVSLDAEFPALRGPSDVEFSFNLELTNETPEEVQFGLQGEGPSGWQVTARPSGQTRASSVTVAAGSSERVTVEVDPPDFTPAGTYSVLVRAAGGGETAATELTVEITGNYELALVTPDERLNLDVEAGQATELPLVVVNEGTAPLTDVSLSATSPRGWEVTFAPESLDRIEPGASAEVTATITPSGEAIAGDYRLTLRTTVAETSDSVELRATVKTSGIWGLVGVGVIAVALSALAAVFRRFGRR